MNKNEYLKALKEALKNIDITVMEEIVADYEEHFQVGMENGKSEEQICKELGSINELIKEINEVYNTGNKEEKMHADEKPNSEQSNEGHDNWYFNTDADGISNTINRVLDSASNTINQALHATTEAINKVDTKEISDMLKNTMEYAASQLNNFTDNYYEKHPGSFDSYNMHTESYQDNITKSYDTFEPGSQKINLVVDGLCADLHVKESTNGKVNIRYENNGNERHKQKYAFYSFKENNTIYAGIRHVGNAVFLFNFKPYSIIIYLEIPKNIGAVDIKTASGNIRINHVKPERIFTQTASGDISFGRVDAEEIQIKSSSGDFRIVDGNSVQINAETISGDIKAKNITAKDISLKTTSGDVEAENTKADIIDYGSLSGSLDIIHLKTGECKIKSTSGDIEINDSTMNNAEVCSVSGDIELFTIAGESLCVWNTSGDIELDVNVRRCRASSKSGDIEASLSGDVVLDLGSTSGSIHIRLKNYNNGYRIKSRTVSGKLSIHYNDLHKRNLKTGTYTYGNQGSELILSSISGDIQIND